MSAAPAPTALATPVTPPAAEAMTDDGRALARDGVGAHEPATPAVALRGLVKRFTVRRPLRAALRHPFRAERVTALDDVTLDVPAGICYGLLGPNGAGKSTLFKILATLVRPDQGAAGVCGADVVYDASTVRELLASASTDERSLYWRLSAQENLRLYASLYGLRGAERSVRVREALAVVGLADVGGLLVGQFSSGMRQRLLVARALLPRPAVLLLDEPTRALDPVSARDFRRFLREEIIGRRGATVMLATHNSEEAFELCDRVGILHRGRLLAEGPARTLAARYADGRLDAFTRDAAVPALTATAGELGAQRLGEHPADEAGWTRVSLQLPGGPDAAARLIARLAEQGVPLARVEAVRPSLAELLERVVEHHERARPRAGEVDDA